MKRKRKAMLTRSTKCLQMTIQFGAVEPSARATIKRRQKNKVRTSITEEVTWWISDGPKRRRMLMAI